MNRLTDIIQILERYQSHSRVVTKHEYNIYCSLIDEISKLADLYTDLQADIISPEGRNTIVYRHNDDELLTLTINPPIIGQIGCCNYVFETSNNVNVSLSDIHKFVINTLS